MTNTHFLYYTSLSKQIIINPSIENIIKNMKNIKESHQGQQKTENLSPCRQGENNHEHTISLRLCRKFLRPQKLKDARKNFEEGTISQEKLTAVEDECILELVAKIKELEYHVITDGEFRRSTWHLDFMWGFEGIEHQKTVEGIQHLTQKLQ